MNISNNEILKKIINSLLANYDCYDVYFLDKNGKWQKNPQTLRDIISSELWFRIYLSFQTAKNNQQSLPILEPITGNQNCQELVAKFNKIAADIEDDFVRTLSIFELIYGIIEYDVYSLNSTIYVPEWNYFEKKIQQKYQKRIEEFDEKLKELLIDRELIDTFYAMHSSLKQVSLFRTVSEIIAEEIRLLERLPEYHSHPKESKEIKEIYNLFSTNIGFDIGNSVVRGQALVIPLLRLLELTDRCEQRFEIISLLGALNDPRCSKMLFNLLSTTKLEKINLICSIIYALSNSRYKELPAYLKRIIILPDYIEISSGYKQPLSEIKYEAIWALGKSGIASKNVVGEMSKLKDHKDNSVRIALGWALGMIGAEEKMIDGAIDVKIISTLLDFLDHSDIKLFEEAVYSIKKIGLYEILDNLNLHNIPSIPVLSLKPSSIGLYELSETIYHLVSVKKPVVMAVTGDSGTGKTYFCEAIKQGFGSISKDDILYLMRDNSAHRTIFSRMLDQKWTKEFLDPQYYTMEFMNEQSVSPAQFFANFIEQNVCKKVIILDGWLDDIYFYQVLKTFYQYGYLDCIVNFRTTYSTRRINLETREGILERVKDCLRFVEKPPIEETEFYRNGDVFVYNLDNSIGSRLSADEIKEVFGRKKIGFWAEHIRIGNFEKGLKELKITKETLHARTEGFVMQNDSKIETEEEAIEIHTEHFFRSINNDIVEESNLLQKIKLKKFIPEKISHYSPGMIAYHNTDGIVGILTGINDQNYFTKIRENKIYDHCIYNDLIFAIGKESKIYAFDFNKNLLNTLKISAPPLSAIATNRNNIIATGHEDGTIRLWDIDSLTTKILVGHKEPVLSISVTKNGMIASNGKDGEFGLWNLRENSKKTYKDLRFATPLIGIHPSGYIFFAKEDCILLLNLIGDETKTIILPSGFESHTFYPYYDGRIFVGGKDKENADVLIAIEPETDGGYYNTIGKHEGRITGIITMGPRIISSGIENDGAVIKIWGSETYVQSELEKLKILKDSKKHFQYYSMIF